MFITYYHLFSSYQLNAQFLPYSMPVESGLQSALNRHTVLYINHQPLCPDYYLFINIYLLYMFRASSAHLQEDTVVNTQYMLLSISMRVPGG